MAPEDRRKEVNPALFQFKSFLRRLCIIMLIFNGLEWPPEILAGQQRKGIGSSRVTTNTVESAFSLLKRGIMGTWHKISAKHLPAYLDEMSFRFNRRKNANLFLDTLRHMVTAPVLTFEKLTA